MVSKQRNPANGLGVSEFAWQSGALAIMLSAKPRAVLYIVYF